MNLATCVENKKKTLEFEYWLVIWPFELLAGWSNPKSCWGRRMPRCCARVSLTDEAGRRPSAGTGLNGFPRSRDQFICALTEFCRDKGPVPKMLDPGSLGRDAYHCGQSSRTLAPAGGERLSRETERVLWSIQPREKPWAGGRHHSQSSRGF